MFKKKRMLEKEQKERHNSFLFLNKLNIKTNGICLKIFNQKDFGVLKFNYNYIENKYSQMYYNVNYSGNIILYSEEFQIIFAGINIFEFYNFLKTFNPDFTEKILKDTLIEVLEIQN